MKLDMDGIYNNVLGHIVEYGTSFITPPKNTGFSLMPKLTREQIVLADSYKPETKQAHTTIWYFTMTENGINLKISKKSLAPEIVLIIARSYVKLLELIKPYMKGD